MITTNAIKMLLHYCIRKNRGLLLNILPGYYTSQSHK